MSVSDNIKNDVYKVKIVYPVRPSKPVLQKNATSAQAREYADLLAAYESAGDNFNASREAYRAEENRLYAKFREDVESEYGMREHPKREKLWAKAWDRGHSEGLSQVLWWYDDLYELVA